MNIRCHMACIFVSTQFSMSLMDMHCQCKIVLLTSQ
jgi:hypothetical protein